MPPVISLLCPFKVKRRRPRTHLFTLKITVHVCACVCSLKVNISLHLKTDNITQGEPVRGQGGEEQRVDKVVCLCVGVCVGVWEGPTS